MPGYFNYSVYESQFTSCSQETVDTLALHTSTDSCTGLYSATGNSDIYYHTCKTFTGPYFVAQVKSKGGDIIGFKTTGNNDTDGDGSVTGTCAVQNGNMASYTDSRTGSYSATGNSESIITLARLPLALISLPSSNQKGGTSLVSRRQATMAPMVMVWLLELVQCEMVTWVATRRSMPRAIRASTTW